MKYLSRLMRSLTCILLVMIILTAQLPAKAAVPGSTSMATSGSKYVVTASYLNFRAGPGTNYRVITGLSRGTQVTYLDYKNGWWRVRTSGGSVGYVDRKYLTPASVDKTGKYFVTASAMRVRKSPTTSSAVRGTIAKGTMITISQLNGDWGYIYYNGYGGWVPLKYLKKK